MPPPYTVAGEGRRQKAMQRCVPFARWLHGMPLSNCRRRAGAYRFARCSATRRFINALPDDVRLSWGAWIQV